MKTPILGGSYVARSVNAADNRMVNLFPEAVPEGGKEPAFLQRVPCLQLWAYADGSGGLANRPIRGMLSTYDLAAAGTPAVLYVVLGTNANGALYKTLDGSIWTNLGAITGEQSVSMASSGSQVFIATSDGTSYILDIATDTLTQITDADFPGARSVTYIDGYFVFCTGQDQKVWCTDLLDGLSIDPLNFASAESSPDPVMSVVALQDELWVFGTQTTEVWYNAGNAGFPFAPINGARMDTGCVTGFSISKLGNSLFWLGQDSNGRCIVYRSNGYTANRISNQSIEWQIQSYNIPGPPFDSNRDLEPWSYAYQQDGHSFYVLTIPSGGTWVYDTTTEMWHQRTASVNWGIPFHRGRCQAFFSTLNNGQRVLIGDYARNVIYYYDPDYYSDWYDGVTRDNVQWVRSWRALATGQNNLNRTTHHSLQLDCETGVQSASDPVADPQVTLKWSDDGGHTWTSGTSISMGATTNYAKRVIWRRLGMTMKLRDRVYEVSGTDPVKIAIMGAELLLSPTNA